MGYQRGELDICGGGTPPVYGETHTLGPYTHTHTLKHTHHGLADQRIAGGVQMLPPLPEQQVDRHFFFMMSALSVCTFQKEQHELAEFPARGEDRLRKKL